MKAKQKYAHEDLSFERFFLGVTCLLVLGPETRITAQGRWHQSEFVLGTFWDPPYGTRPEDHNRSLRNFKLAKDANFNLLTGTQIEPNIERSFEGMKFALNLAKDVGLKYLVTDERFFPSYEIDCDTSTARKIIADYKRLPSQLRRALYGYNLCDEPHFIPTHLRRIREWKNFLERNDSEKLAYINLVGSFAASYKWGGFHSGNHDHILDGQEKTEYESYLEFYVDKVDPSVVSFDHYPFFSDGSIRRDYFYNLSIIRKKSGARPFWAYPMTVGHQVYADPTEEQLNFMYFSPIAYGAKGLVVFCFWTPHDRKEYRQSLVGEDGNPTANYYLIKRLNDYVAKVLAPCLMGAKSVGVWHASEFPQAQLYIEDQINRGSDDFPRISDRRMMVGVFQGKKFRYFLVVNKGLRKVLGSQLTVKGLIKNCGLSPRVTDFDGSQAHFLNMKPRLDLVEKTSTISIPDLNGGEGILIRVLN